MNFYFYGEKHPLSNTYKSPFKLGSFIYPTVEHYFQTKKTDSFEEMVSILMADTPNEAKKLGRWVEFPVDEEEWEIKQNVYMAKAIKAKFTQNDKLKKFLLGTKDKVLVNNDPYDKYWGAGIDGEGENMCGIILMDLRKELMGVL
jgi:ribA/ribD-fused uncharacterized protein